MDAPRKASPIECVTRIAAGTGTVGKYFRFSLEREPAFQTSVPTEALRVESGVLERFFTTPVGLATSGSVGAEIRDAVEVLVDRDTAPRECLDADADDETVGADVHELVGREPE